MGPSTPPGGTLLPTEAVHLRLGGLADARPSDEDTLALPALAASRGWPTSSMALPASSRLPAVALLDGTAPDPAPPTAPIPLGAVAGLAYPVGVAVRGGEEWPMRSSTPAPGRGPSRRAWLVATMTAVVLIAVVAVVAAAGQGRSRSYVSGQFGGPAGASASTAPASTASLAPGAGVTAGQSAGSAAQSFTPAALLDVAQTEGVITDAAQAAGVSLSWSQSTKGTHTATVAATGGEDLCSFTISDRATEPARAADRLSMHCATPTAKANHSQAPIRDVVYKCVATHFAGSPGASWLSAELAIATAGTSVNARQRFGLYVFSFASAAATTTFAVESSS